MLGTTAYLEVKSLTSRVLDQTTFGYVILPILSIALSAVTQAGPSPSLLSVRPTSCCDLFGFLVLLDANLILFKSDLIGKVNPMIANNFGPTFFLAGAIALFLVIMSGKLQYSISSRSKRAKYPLGTASAYAVFAIVLTGFHLYALVSK